MKKTIFTLACCAAIHTMKKSIILIFALPIIGLMLVSCSSQPETTTTTTRQTTVTSVSPLLMATTHTRPLSGQPQTMEPF
jgi:uncharacterized protein YcfL